MNVPLCPVTRFLRNLTPNFDETLYVVQAYTEEGFGTIGMPRYPLVWLLEPLD